MVFATSSKASISSLQRTLRVGYHCAAWLVEQVEQMGWFPRPTMSDGAKC